VDGLSQVILRSAGRGQTYPDLPWTPRTAFGAVTEAPGAGDPGEDFVVLLAADGTPNMEVAELIGVSPPTVNLWRNRYAKCGDPGPLHLDLPLLAQSRRGWFGADH
jgi:hypothetical protein